jgi:putative membrane protein
MLDLGLAIAHHVLVFGLVAMLAIERVMVRGPSVEVMRLARVDGGYGVTAMLVLVVGVSRVVWGGKGWTFYQENPFFWGKVGAFALIGLISIGPTMRFLRWARATRADAAWQPPAAELKAVRTSLGLQALLLVVLLACAAAMARWPF